MNLFFVEHLKSYVEKEHGPTVLENVLQKAHTLPEENIGSYFVCLIDLIADEINAERSGFIEEFGFHISKYFLDQFDIPENISIIDLLAKSDIYINNRGRQNELQIHNTSVNAIKINERRAEIIYSSPRNLPELALGLVRGAAAYTGDKYLKTECIKLSDGNYLIICIKS